MSKRRKGCKSRAAGKGYYCKSEYMKVDVNSLFDKYMSTKIALRSTTTSNYILLYNKLVRDTFGRNKVEDVKYSDVLGFYVSLVRSGIAKGTLTNINAMLVGTFKMAVRDGLIDSNPAVGAITEIRGISFKPKRVMKALTLDEERRFLAFLDRPEYVRWKPLFMIMFGTGLRGCEAFALIWDDVDLDDRMINVSRGITYMQRADDEFRCSHRISPTKTHTSTRKVPMLDEVRNAFLLEKNYQESSGSNSDCEVDGVKGFIFSSKKGRPLSTNIVNRRIRSIVGEYNALETKAAAEQGREPELLPMFSCHTTRHTFCTRLCENGTNVKLIQTVMGHSSIKTTLDIYAEVTEKTAKDIFKGLNDKDVL